MAGRWERLKIVRFPDKDEKSGFPLFSSLSTSRHTGRNIYSGRGQIALIIVADAPLRVPRAYIVPVNVPPGVRPLQEIINVFAHALYSFSIEKMA